MGKQWVYNNPWKFELSSDSFKGKFAVTNPNFNNTDKSLYVSAEALEFDNYQTYGYKTTKTGFSIGTNFEYPTPVS